MDTSAAEVNCDPKVTALKKTCEQLKESNMQKQFLRNELSQVEAARAEDVKTYVNLQETLMAIPQAFQPMAEGKTTMIQPVRQHASPPL